MPWNPSLKHPRTLLGIPPMALAWLAILVGITLRFLSRLIGRLDQGTFQHVYIPLVLARRVLTGEPMWQSHDLRVGRQPRTAKAIAAADADPELEKIQTVCMCGKPDCAAKNGKMIYVFRADYVSMPMPVPTHVPAPSDQKSSGDPE